MVVMKNTIQGRQIIAMKKIAKKNNLQVTFCKRRAGLFKKASELCTICGVDDVATIVFSPAGNVFSFGHPRVESTIDRFLPRNPSFHNLKTNKLVEAHRTANIRELNVQLSRLLDMLEVEKRKGEGLDEMREAGRRQCWWQAPVDKLGLNELQQLRDALDELMRDVRKQANLLQVATESSHCWPFLTANGIGNEVNEMNAASNTTQIYKFGEGLL